MCEFKYCQGEHACFLRMSSPCPRAKAWAAKARGDDQILVSMSEPGQQSKGFLDRNRLIEVLGIEGSDRVPVEQNVVRITSKLRRVASRINSPDHPAVKNAKVS